MEKYAYRGTEMDGKPEIGTQSSNRSDEGKSDKKRIDLSLPQVAGSGAAALVAAYLASFLGVYGTIMGAAVVSVLATTGGAIFQHFFHRTGEQLRESTLARPYDRAPQRGAGPAPDPAAAAVPSALGEYGEATTHGTRVRGRRRPLLAAGTLFVAVMVLVTGIELAAGSSMASWWGNGGKGGTTFSRAVDGGGSSHTTPRHQPSQDSTGGGTDDGGSGGTDGGASHGPDGSGGGRGGSSTDPSPDPSPSTGASTGPSPSPDPSGSQGSGQDQGQGQSKGQTQGQGAAGGGAAGGPSASAQD
ncbi:hypothetical protein ABZ832_07555 [Streptantibioticus parmotrematis]|uniref:hypothetical protein n=1 Tax=Streptantibioticus parmotrematis TaxID=2873249 RepID=UPI0033E81E16